MSDSHVWVEGKKAEKEHMGCLKLVRDKSRKLRNVERPLSSDTQLWAIQHLILY